MGGFEPYATINLSPRIAAWQAHFERIGCSKRKARELAMKRVTAGNIGRAGRYPPQEAHEDDQG